MAGRSLLADLAGHLANVSQLPIQRRQYQDQMQQQSLLNKLAQDRLGLQQQQFDYGKQQDQLGQRQHEVDAVNRLLGYDGRPVQYNIQEPKLPTSPEAGASGLVSQGIDPNDPRVQAFIRLHELLNPPKQGPVQPNAYEAGSGLLSQFDQQVGDYQKDQGRFLRETTPTPIKNPETGQTERYVYPPSPYQQPDFGSLLRSQLPTQEAIGGQPRVDSIMAYLRQARPNLIPQQPRRANPLNPADQAAGISGGLRNGSLVPQQRPAPPPNDGSLTEEQYRLFVEKWNRGEIPQ